eukprot:scaffold194962_cov22-Tisochrysis_lutea.AAC.1
MGQTSNQHCSKPTVPMHVNLAMAMARRRGRRHLYLELGPKELPRQLMTIEHATCLLLQPLT